jgi:hypothetical protein
MVAEETNKFGASSQRKYCLSNWEDTNVHEIEAYIGEIICMGTVDLLTLFLWRHCKIGH